MAKYMLSLSLNRLQRAMVAGMATALVSGAGLAAEWTTSTEIALGGVYTDNLFLTEANKEGSWVMLATPGVTLRGEGRNLPG